MQHADTTFMSKLCDAADWFNPAIQQIIATELREIPRFHRKQWESAMILLALRHGGKLRPEHLGLSMGGGRERVLYAIAPYLRQLVVTDLYENQTDWECARTDDPERFVKDAMPFPVDPARITAMRMDMRDLAFPDRTFDFCYSTCAIEHIGTRPDFRRHFAEVARVLKDDGIYVCTTEILYGEDSITDHHNWIFSLPDLHEIIAESGLTPGEAFDARLTEHRINYPFPSTLNSLAHGSPAPLAEGFLRESPHLQLLRGRVPFTCGIFLLRKRPAVAAPRATTFVGLDASRAFIERGVDSYRALMGSSAVSISPFSLLPGENSRFFADHIDFIAGAPGRGTDPETVFHTDYFWFGSGVRCFDVSLETGTEAWESLPDIEIRIHRFRTTASDHVECVAQCDVPFREPGAQTVRLIVDTDDEYSYAVLAKSRKAGSLFTAIGVRSAPDHLVSSFREPLFPARTSTLTTPV